MAHCIIVHNMAILLREDSNHILQWEQVLDALVLGPANLIHLVGK